MGNPKIGRSFLNTSIEDAVTAAELQVGDQGTVAPDLPKNEPLEDAEARSKTGTVDPEYKPEYTPESDPAVFEPLGNDLAWDDPSRGGTPPDPPKCVQERLRKFDRVWRWLSVPHVGKLGMRNFESVSLTKEEKKAIRAGDIGHPTISIGVDNTLRWREDSWLASCPRRLHDARARLKSQRTLDQTKLSLNTEEIEDQAMRKVRNKGIRGAKFKMNVTQWKGDSRRFNTDD